MATQKFEALTHFIVHECRDNPGRLGATRLNKALWYADMIFYKTAGKSITEDSYVKRQNGPVPKHILRTLDKLKAEGALAVTEPEYQYDTRRFMSLKEPAEHGLTEIEQNIAKAALEMVCGKSASGVSEDTHDIVWKAAQAGEDIPMCATLAAKQGDITMEVIHWANESIMTRAA